MSKKNRPRIKIKTDVYDVIFEVLGLLALIFMIIFPLVNYAELPDQIPMHYNAAGEVDSYGAKAIVWAIPGIALILYAFLFWVSKKPHIFNYTVEITEENAARHYRTAVRIMNILKSIMAWTFGYITFTTVRVGMGVQDGLGKYFLIIVLALVFIPIGFMIFSSRKK
ncbi:MAG: hypothetical protein C0592_13135 [Marinilabiliales bacterium]|nr:MAG: hypothetical protein C0592_13135 [Marinilabiliales bacterium]